MKRIKLEHPNSSASVEIDESQLPSMEYNGWKAVKTAPAKSAIANSEAKEHGKSKRK